MVSRTPDDIRLEVYPRNIEQFDRWPSLGSSSNLLAIWNIRINGIQPGDILSKLPIWNEDIEKNYS